MTKPEALTYSAALFKRLKRLCHSHAEMLTQVKDKATGDGRNPMIQFMAEAEIEEAKQLEFLLDGMLKSLEVIEKS